MARKKPSKTPDQLTDQAVALAEFAVKAIVAAEKLRISTNTVEHVPLEEFERAMGGNLLALNARLKKKLAKKNASFTIAETAGMLIAVADSFLPAEPRQQVALLMVAKKLIDCLERSVVMRDLPAKAKKASLSDTVYQFKITLLGAKPPIWRRIQVQDCTLDELHEYIQTAMGWSNSHLHQFRIGKQRYGDPMLMEEDFEEFGYQDSITTAISEILPQSGRRFRFRYEYDFGDSWEHEILFEGVVKAESKVKYPLCLEGARACPPEDCGGIWGYPDFVETIQNPDNERHEELLDWVGGRFDPEEFDPTVATKSMKKGLPDWRRIGDFGE
jgi:hypothetical protein